MNTIKFDVGKVRDIGEKLAELNDDQLTKRDVRILKLGTLIPDDVVVINVKETITRGGFHESGAPKLAICVGGAETVECRRRGTGMGFGGQRRFSMGASFVENQAFTMGGLPDHGDQTFFETVVPFVPIKLRPADDIDNYHILFEAPHWDILPRVVDPILLKRIDGDLFEVIAIWDMTELEAFASGL